MAHWGFYDGAGASLKPDILDVMERELRDHPANEDDADRHGRARRVPALVAIAVAIVAIAALAYMHVKGVTW
jgi:hypothetical protein